MTFSANMQKRRLSLLAAACSALLLTGCGMLEPDYESQQRQALRQVGQGLGLRPFTDNDSGQPALALPVLDAGANREDYLRFALLNHPRVQAAFYRWWQQVEAITPARSLPDPVLTFQADITDMLMSLMPGLMMEIPGWGKLEAAGKEAAAMAEVAYREYQMALYGTAAELRISWAQLHYSTQMVALGEQALVALGQSVAVAGAQYGTGGMGGGSLQMQAEQMNAKARAAAQLEDRRDALAAAQVRFKSALGLRRADADPHWPQGAFGADSADTAEALWEQAITRNPRLEMLRAMAQTALTQVQMAEREGNPDFAVGLMVDVKPNPLMFRPELGMSLPVWRDKIAALQAAAGAGALAAQAELSASELELAAELTQALAMLRRSERQRTYFSSHALPNIERSLASADVSYRSGGGDFGSLVALRLMELQMREELAMADLDAALALAELSMLTARPLPDETLLASAPQ